MTKKLLLGTESGIQVMKKENGAWAQSAESLDGKWVQKLEIDSSGRMYAGVTKDGVYWADSPSGAWTQGLEGDIRGLGVSPHQSGTVFAGTEPAAVFRSRDRGESWVELKAVKELPSYPTWSFPAPPFISHVRTFDFVADEPDTVFAGVEVGGLIRSGDGGETWESYGQGIYEDIHYILSHPRDSKVMYSTTGDGFYRSMDGARNWEHLQDGMDNPYTHPIILDSQDPNLLYIGAAADNPTTFGGPGGALARIYRSRDAGSTWERLGNGLPDRLHAMVRGLVADPVTPGAVYAGTTDGELFASEDAGDSWEQIASGLPAVWVIRVSGD